MFGEGKVGNDMKTSIVFLSLCSTFSVPSRGVSTRCLGQRLIAAWLRLDARIFMGLEMR